MRRPRGVPGGAEALLRRSVERAETGDPAAFTLQLVMLEYMTDRLVDEVGDEIMRGRPVLLVEQPLIKAHAEADVRQTQERLIGSVLERLKVANGDGGAEQRLLALLERWRRSAIRATGLWAWQGGQPAAARAR